MTSQIFSQKIVKENKTKEKYVNRLAKESSPYLLQHKNNPVDWYPWGREAFDKARELDRPIFLSIGYSTCHWCHVCLLYTSPSPRDQRGSRMPSSA